MGSLFHYVDWIPLRVTQKESSISRVGEITFFSSLVASRKKYTHRIVEVIPRVCDVIE